MNRRELLRAGVVLGTLLRARPARGQTASPLRIATVASESAGAAFYAQDEGFFAKHGLSWQISISTGGAAMAAAILGGDLDIGEADVVTMAIAHDKGLPFVYLAPGELHSLRYPTLACVVTDASLRPGKDYNGKTMACNVSRGFGSLVANAWIDNNGGDSTTVKWIEMPFPALAAALQHGTIDGYCAPEPFVTAGIAAGGHLALMDRKPVAPTFLQGGWFASRDWVAKNPGAAAAFTATLRETNAWANSNREQTAEILAKYSKMPLAMIEGLRFRGQYEVTFNTGTMQPLIDAAAKYDYIANAFPAADIVWRH